MAHSAVEGGGLLGGGCAPSHLKGPAPQELEPLDQTNLRGGGVGGGGLNSHHPNLTLVHLSCLAFSRLGGSLYARWVISCAGSFLASTSIAGGFSFRAFGPQPPKGLIKKPATSVAGFPVNSIWLSQFSLLRLPLLRYRRQHPGHLPVDQDLRLHRFRRTRPGLLPLQSQLTALHVHHSQSQPG